MIKWKLIRFFRFVKTDIFQRLLLSLRIRHILRHRYTYHHYGILIELLDLRQAMYGIYVNDKEMLSIAQGLVIHIHYYPNLFIQIPKDLRRQWPERAINCLAAWAPTVIICQGRFENYGTLDSSKVFKFWDKIKYKRAEGLSESARMVLYKRLGGR